MKIICHESSFIDSAFHIFSKPYHSDQSYTFLGAPSIYEHIILNDGCARFEFHINGCRYESEGDLVCGKFINVPKIKIHFLDTTKDLTIIRLAPFTLSQLSDAPVEHFVDRAMPISVLNLPEESQNFQTLASVVDRIAMSNMEHLPYARIIDVIHHISNHFSELPKSAVHDIAHRFSLSDSTLRRYFKKYTGISLSNYLLTIKRKKMIQSLYNNCYDSLHVQENGYYDQSHFLNDFKRLYGFPLRQYFNRLQQMQNQEPELIRFLYHCNIEGE